MSAAYLLLDDGTRFDGEGAGAVCVALGEAVFTTGMTGYQETLTDPSFNGQIITFSAPMIGNYGVEADVGESDRVQAVGMVCREARNAQPPGREGLLDWLAGHGVPVLFGIDTRALVQHLRDHGAQRAALVTDGTPPEEARRLIDGSPEMAGQDLAAAVSRPRREQGPDGGARCTVALLDYGAKDSIGDLVAAAGAHVVILPHDATADDVRAVDPDGVLLANGPGDPGAMDAHVANVQAMLELDVPVFGICLGHQLLARALGLGTYKLRFGHRGANHPVLETETGRVLVTSQNHGFAVEPPAGAGGVVITHRSLYDDTVEGLRLDGRPVWSMQFHPEASPGPHDARDALAAFVDEAAAHRESRSR
mgnify:CR=1 FL=1